MLTLSSLMAIAIVSGVLFALLHRVWTTLALLVYTLCFVVLVSAIKQAYLGMAASLADVVFFLRHPVGNFRLFINYPLLGLALMTVLGGFLACVLIGLRFERPMHHWMAVPRRWWWRGASATLCMLAALTGVLVTRSLHARMTEEDVFAAFESMNQLQTTEGFVNRLNFFFDNRGMDITLPTRRDQRRFVSSSLLPSSDSRPDLLIVLEESTFDTRVIRDCSIADCDHAFLHPPLAAQRNLQGPLLVHSTGGGTWLSEFAFLTGFDWRVFGRGGAFAPMSVAPRVTTSLPLQLRRLGYRTIAIIPTDANFLSARSAYRHYGFDEFHAAADLHLPNDWQAIRDSMLFDAALRLAKQPSKQQPLFIFVLTLRNHGPHGADADVAIQPQFAHLGPTLGDSLADYLGRMRDSSQDFQRLASRWLSSQRPRVIGWFGDHQPEAAWDVTRDAQRLTQVQLASNVDAARNDYLTFYQMAANFGATEQHESVDALDVALLGSQLWDFAGLPVTADTQAATHLRSACRGLLLLCPDHDLVADYLSYRVHELHALR